MIRFLAVFLALVATVHGQEIVGPETVDAGVPAWFSVEGVPDGASVAFLPNAAIDTNPARIVAGQCMFWVAKPGDYSISAMVVDWDKHTLVPITKNISVEGENGPDPPTPPVPVPPDAAKWVMIVEESKDRTPEAAAILAQLRRQMESAAIPYRIIDPDSVVSWMEPYLTTLANSQKNLPALLVIAQPKDGPSSVLAVETMPGRWQEAWSIIEEATQ